ncbi:MAG: hypothetical protein IJC61_04675 [Oscillospiraceae bacterium]|nr:hypothetical protein [Oscillospiraceae bacterium]
MQNEQAKALQLQSEADRTEAFLDKYRQLEEVAIEEYGYLDNGNAISNLERRKEFKDISSQLSYCRKVRNLLCHTPKIDEAYAVTPSEGMLELLDTLITRITRPLRAQDIYTAREKLMCKSLGSYVLPSARDMSRRHFSHLPILQDNRLVGVFSESTLTTLLLAENGVRITEKTRFSDIQHYLKIENHTAERFLFVGRKTPAGDLVSLFEDALRPGNRIGMVFVTETGDPGQRILGVITAWDIAAI